MEIKNIEKHVQEHVCDDALKIIKSMLKELKDKVNRTPYEDSWIEITEQWLSYVQCHGKELFTELKDK